MKKFALIILLGTASTAAYSQDSMNKKMDNPTDKMNKKMENKTDKMNKKMHNTGDTTATIKRTANSATHKRKL